MFVAERATNIERQSTFGGSTANFHVKKYEINQFCPEGSLFFPFAPLRRKENKYYTSALSASLR